MCILWLRRVVPRNTICHGANLAGTLHLPLALIFIVYHSPQFSPSLSPPSPRISCRFHHHLSQEFEYEQDPTIRSTHIAIPGARKNSIRNDGNIWLPYCLKEAELEMKECYAAGKAFRSGSVVCHETCADYMDRMRHKVVTSS